MRNHHRLSLLENAVIGPECLGLARRPAVESFMKLTWLVIAIAGLTLVAADQAAARAKHHRHYRHRAHYAHCVDRPKPFSWGFLLPGGAPAPEPNGCAPPVHEYGRYVGQDPDANIRFQLRRDPATGYSGDLYP